MAPRRRLAVVVLYNHPLLGEGVGKLLAAEDGLDVTLVSSHEEVAAERALGAEPDVVILERGAGLKAADVLLLAPDALLIDIGIDPGRSWTYHREEIAPRLESILRAIRRLRRAGPGSDLEQPVGIGSDGSRAIHGP